MARRAFTSHPLVLRRVTVRRNELITPRMRRIVLGGDGLRGFAAPGFDDHVKLLFAASGDVAAVLPRQLPGGIEWTPAPDRLTRDYTPRRVDLAAEEITLDVVVHGGAHGGNHGPAAQWAERAAPGDDLHFVGPKSSVRLPPDLDWVVLVGDETGLPAIGRFLEERPVDVPAIVRCLVEDECARQDLPVRTGDDLQWVLAAGGDAVAVEDVVRGLDLPPGQGYVWAAAESRTLLPVRRYLLRERGLPKDRVNVTGYWNAAPETSGTAGPDQDPEPAAVLPADPTAWFVVRAALDLGLVDLLADGPRCLAELATGAGITPTGLQALVPVLTHHGVLIATGERLRLGPAGAELLDEHVREEFHGPAADLVLSLSGLVTALRTGTSTWQAAHGETLTETAARDPDVADLVAEHAGGLAFLLDTLLGEDLFTGASSLVASGPGVPALLGALEDAGSTVPVALLGGVDPEPVLDGLRAHLEDPGHSTSPSTDPAALIVLAQALLHRTDAQAREVFAAAASAGRDLVVLERARADELSANSVGAQVLAVAMTGTPLRDAAAVSALAAPAGWRFVRELDLGWGMVATVLQR